MITILIMIIVIVVVIVTVITITISIAILVIIVIILVIMTVMMVIIIINSMILICIIFTMAITAEPHHIQRAASQSGAGGQPVHLAVLLPGDTTSRNTRIAFEAPQYVLQMTCETLIALLCNDKR